MSEGSNVFEIQNNAGPHLRCATLSGDQSTIEFNAFI
jgi:hypothetical protein